MAPHAEEPTVYFAYGSNLDRRQMAERCPLSRFLAVARLDHHRLHFPLRSPIRNCAVASIEPFRGGVVWGALYEMVEDDFTRLDAREGYHPSRPANGNRYNRMEITVRRTDGCAVGARTYVANPMPDPGLPSAAYLAHMISGAIACGLPEAYVDMLRAIVTTPALAVDGG